MPNPTPDRPAQPSEVHAEIWHGYSPACGCRYCQERKRREETRDE